MKRILVCLLIMGLTVSVWSSVKNAPDSSKMLSITEHQAGNISAVMSNYNTINDLVFQNDTEPLRMLYTGASWISAKRFRRDEQNRKLYWLAPIPSADNSGTTYYGAPDWNPSLLAVLDTLTTVGFDGDSDVYEFLPAHNPLSVANDYYGQYNQQDKALLSILGSPAPRPFLYPDPQGNYCFTGPLGPSFETPGFETISAYYYDFCPFGTVGDRDLGSGRTTNTHFPLGLAVHQESYAWNLQNLHKLLVVKRTVYNTSAIDTLFDLAIGEFMDCDIQPYDEGLVGASDDVSGYVKGDGLEFAYSRDFDGDDGSCTTLLGSKIILPRVDLRHHAWFWKVGDGPDDSHPLSFNYSPRRTANEKYYLSIGRNPNFTKYLPLRPEFDDIMEYEQPQANDTRFLNTIYGAWPGSTNYPTHRWDLHPGQSITYYSVVFVGDTLDDLKTKSQWTESFIAGGMDLGNIDGLTCIPYLMPVTVNQNETLSLQWHSYTNPDHFTVLYKEVDSPASAWYPIILAGDVRNYTISGFPFNTWLEIKLGSTYNPGPNEVYLESNVQLIFTNYDSASIDPVMPVVSEMRCYPNPFNPSLNIDFEIKQSQPATLKIYNSRGQLIRNLAQDILSAGTHHLIWDGKNEQGQTCANGVYLMKLETPAARRVEKVLLLK